MNTATQKHKTYKLQPEGEDAPELSLDLRDA
jgi:hypothetical protein